MFCQLHLNLGGVGRECQAWMCKCLLQCETISFQTFLCQPNFKKLQSDEYFKQNVSLGGVPAVLPLHQPRCVQLCHRRQPYWGIHVFWGIPQTCTSFEISRYLRFLLIYQKHNTSGHCLLRLPLLHHLCRLPLPGRLRLNKRLVFCSVLQALKEKLKTVLCCQYFQFVLKKAMPI